MQKYQSNQEIFKEKKLKNLGFHFSQHAVFDNI